VYAFDGNNGARKWFQPATPTSSISAGASQIYMIEDGNKLVVRNQSDGSVVWTQPVANAGRQSPVIVPGAVIVASNSGVYAFDLKTGGALWSASIPGAAAPVATRFLQGHYGAYQLWTAAVGSDVWQVDPTTTMAAATGSGTLIVTAPDAVHVLGLNDGKERWKGTMSQAQGPVREPVIVSNRVYVVDTPDDPSKAGLLALGG
jgi:outer membrane protein assembly factor BamB